MGLKNYVTDGEGNMIPTGRRNFKKIFSPFKKKYPNSPEAQKPFVARFIMVQGLKRKIVVMFHDNISGPLEMEDIKRAAVIADKRGWKRVVIDFDMVDASTYEVFNMAQFHASFHSRSVFGIFLLNRPAENQQ